MGSGAPGALWKSSNGLLGGSKLKPEFHQPYRGLVPPVHGEQPHAHNSPQPNSERTTIFRTQKIGESTKIGYSLQGLASNGSWLRQSLTQK